MDLLCQTFLDQLSTPHREDISLKVGQISGEAARLGVLLFGMEWYLVEVVHEEEALE